jgi:excisionase family DNA binding protein
MIQAITITPSGASGVQGFEERGIIQLDIKDVQKLLNGSRTTVVELITQKQLPTIRVGRSVKIPIAGFKKFIAKAMAR